MPDMEKRRENITWIFPVLILLLLSGCLEGMHLFILRFGKNLFNSVNFLIITTKLIMHRLANSQHSIQIRRDPYYNQIHFQISI